MILGWLCLKVPIYKRQVNNQTPQALVGLEGEETPWCDVSGESLYQDLDRAKALCTIYRD